MKNGILWANLLFDGLDDLDIGMVILLQELVIKSFPNFTFKDIEYLRDSLESA